MIRRLTTALRAWYLRRLIAAADTDAQRHDWHAEREPQMAKLARERAQELRVRLVLLTGDKRDDMTDVVVGLLALAIGSPLIAHVIATWGT